MILFCYFTSYSVACIQRELDEMGIKATEKHYKSSENITGMHYPQPQPIIRQQQQQQQQQQAQRAPDLHTTTNTNHGCPNRWPPNVPFGGINGRQNGWMDGLLGCMRPVMSLLGKTNATDLKQKLEEWEIPFESITNLEWLGSGAQGTVFSGYLRNEIVAVKKVRDVKETDIKHLRKLDHENIIKFK